MVASLIRQVETASALRRILDLSSILCCGRGLDAKPGHRHRVRNAAVIVMALNCYRSAPLSSLTLECRASAGPILAIPGPIVSLANQ